MRRRGAVLLQLTTMAALLGARRAGIEAQVGSTKKALAFGFLLVAMVVLSLLLITAKPAHAETFTVNYKGDATDDEPGDGFCDAGFGLCSLRAAIQETNANDNAPVVDVINFNIPNDPNVPGDEVKTMKPTEGLPTVTDQVIINGYSQPGSSPNTRAQGTDAVLKIELSGQNASGLTDGLSITAANCTVKGLVINRWGRYGIEISDATGNKVEGNYLGTDASGNGDLGNNNAGVHINDAPGNIVGGLSPAKRNVISGNNDYGIVIIDPGASGNKVQGNYVGTKATGTRDLGNRLAGVFIVDAPDNTIGGSVAGAQNVISGNSAEGISILGAEASGNKVQRNLIGTNAAGTADLGNGEEGVAIHDAPDNVIGGTSGGLRNVISGNDDEGILIFDHSATGNKVIGNFVGTDKSGTKNIGNTFSGIRIKDSSKSTIGGTVAGSRNVVAFNGADGVTVVNGTGHRILRNSIFSNVELGIDLGGDDVTPNDPGDADTGPNTLQNFPNLTSAQNAGGQTTIKGNLNSKPNKTFTVEFFSNPPNTNEGKKFVGLKSVTTNLNGNVSFTFIPAQAVPVGQSLTATAIDPGGNTSEFSAFEEVSQ